MAYDGIRSPILRTESGVSLLVGYRLDTPTSATGHVIVGYLKNDLGLIFTV